MRPICLLVLACTALCGTSGAEAAAGLSGQVAGAVDPVAVAAPAGPLRGVQDGATAVFKGIPYARPPLGDLRFAPPVALPPWTAERQASAFGPACTQPGSSSEDCLYLNVWTPADRREGERLPVMVFLYGGAYSWGEAGGFFGATIYDGRRLSELGRAVIVTFNYRVGILGFFAEAALAQASGYGGSGNYGALDQVRALEWVQDNIASFRGDAHNVTIFGESAGAVSVCNLVASPLAAGLFSQAIMESGFCLARTQAQVEPIWAGVAAELGCNPERPQAEVVACLRALPAAKILAAQAGRTEVDLTTWLYTPVVDGYFLPTDPLATIQAGRHNAVPMIIGSNANEEPAILTATMTGDQLHDTVRAQLGAAALPVVADLYPFWQYPLPGQKYAALFRDAYFDCPIRTLAGIIAESQVQPVYRYLFSEPLPAYLGPIGPVHASELFYVFQALDLIPLGFPSAEKRALSRTMGEAWTTFARTGTIPQPLAAKWQPYTADGEAYVNFMVPTTGNSHYHDRACAALAPFPSLSQ